MEMLSITKGEGKPPLVLVPGGLTGWISWEKHAELLSQKRKVVRVQLLNVQLGIDDSPLPVDYSVKYESNALAESIEELNLEKPFDIAAWSYGAMITLDYIINHIENIRTATLIEPPALWVLRSRGPLDEDVKETIKTLETSADNITEDMLDEFLQSVGFVQKGESVRKLPQWNTWLPFKQSLRNNPYVVRHNDNTEKLKAFTKPVLLVKGTGSAKFLHQIIDTLHKYFPHSKVTEMPAGHAPHLVSSDRFLNEMKEFQTL
jgi:pimeloyl-ACP methyl ester carboxylesterase